MDNARSKSKPVSIIDQRSAAVCKPPSRAACQALDRKWLSCRAVNASPQKPCRDQV